MKPLQLSEIWIYPVKSMGGIRLSSSRVLPKGLKFDRRWMLVNEHDTCITQRDYPQMALFKLSTDGNQLKIGFKQNLLTVPLHDHDAKPVRATIWNDTVVIHEVSKDHSEWFSEMLGMKCRLVYFPEEHERPVEEPYRVNNDHVSLADAYPFLIIGQSSLDDLNARLESPVPMNRFRPNFVFTGGKPFEEDGWKKFTIGNSGFAGVKPCARCTIPTIDQDTAEKGAEPSKTLASYRRQNNKIYFGQNLIGLACNTVAVGDRIRLSIANQEYVNQ